tara:strand:- start:234 stop:1046 length:813 start_codon:yes stop_codon:yes gene_type:complete
MPDFNNIALGIKEIKKENYEISFEKNNQDKYDVFFKQIELNKLFEEGSKIIIRTTIKPTERIIQPWEKYLDKHSYDGSKVENRNSKIKLDIKELHIKDRLSAFEVIVIDKDKRILGSSEKTTYVPESGEIDSENPEGILDVRFEDMELDFNISYDNETNYKPVTIHINLKLKEKFETDRSFKAYIFLQCMKEIFTQLIFTKSILEPNYKYFLAAFTNEDKTLSKELEHQSDFLPDSDDEYASVRDLVNRGVINIIEKSKLIEEVGRINDG